jgi:natural product precursor
MKKDIKLSKLTLNKQTVRSLSDGEMDKAAGGFVVTGACTGACSNRRGCLTRIADCETNRYIYC